MKKLISLCLLLTLGIYAFARNDDNCFYTEASTLTLVGKLFPETPNPYHRVDTVKYKGFTKSENFQVRMSAGIAVAFKTDSPYIRLKTDFGQLGRGLNTMGVAIKGFDLYIKDGVKWLWAAAHAAADKHEEDPFTLIANMDGSMHECLLYLPILSEINSLEIGIKEGCTIEAVPNPFRWRIGIFGSSFTHGISISRSGMSYPAQFSRSTGLQLLSLGCSGNSKLQPYFAEALAGADVDAFMFDSFSNPSSEQMRERLFPFIERLQTSHPGKPLIFLRTIYRERRNFDTAYEAREKNRIMVADSLMRIACKRYKDVYYVESNATSPDHETSVDGTHPNDYGYTLWARSIEKKVLAILRKYGIK